MFLRFYLVVDEDKHCASFQLMTFHQNALLELFWGRGGHFIISALSLFKRTTC